MPIDDIEGIRRVLSNYKTVAMVGLSANWHRPSNFAAKYLLDHGFKVIPVNPVYDEVLGQKCYSSLKDIPERVDIVDVFRKPEDVPPLVDEAAAIGAKLLWLQLGVINHDAVAQAEAAGLEVVMDRCMKIEFARLFGGLNFVGVNTKIISAKRPRTLPY
jgi:predicted CoA-binding protein